MNPRFNFCLGHEHSAFITPESPKHKIIHKQFDYIDKTNKKKIQHIHTTTDC